MRPQISQDVVTAYRPALAFHKAHIPGDPSMREAHQRAIFDANEALRIALDRNPFRVPILETLETHSAPFYVICRGPAFTDDWKSAISIRKELEQLIRQLA